MSSKVEVLCPNGHRVSVKTTPNTKILQILEEACAKKGFAPTSDYELKHGTGTGRKTLDVTLTVRYAGLLNLAKLELVKAAKSRAEVSVVIALQLENGQRLQHEFQTATSLWELLAHCKAQPEGKESMTCEDSGHHPVCIYMREEVIGEYALKATTLRDLGLTQGRHIIRLVHRLVNDNTLQTIREKVDSEQAKQAKLAAKQAKSQISLEEASVRATPSQAHEPMETDTSEKVDSDSGKTQVKSSESSTSAGSQEHSGESGARPKVGIPASAASGQQPMSPEGQVMAHEFFLPGVFPEPSAAELERQKKEKRREEQMMRMTPMEPVYPLQNFKFPDATKGKDIYHNELGDANKEEYRPCDRETAVYNMDEVESPQVVEDEDLPEDFFEVRDSDIRSMWTSMQKRLAEDVEQPLMTQALRHAKLEEKIAKYPRATIRVHFPDKFVIQGLFRPREAVFALKKFVKDHLEDKATPFYLYTSPPKHILKDDSKSLAEADLSPMAVVYFGCDVRKDNYLASAVLSDKVSQGMADQVIVKHMAKAETASGTSSSATGGEKRPSSGKSSQSRAATSGEEGGKKVPKWFKIGK